MSTNHQRNSSYHDDRYGRGSQRFSARKRAGWGMNLYRNTRDGKIAGVCAGLADHWDIAPWVMRLMWVGAFLFTGTLALWVYLAAWILMAPRPGRCRSRTARCASAGSGCGAARRACRAGPGSRRWRESTTHRP